MYKSPIEVLCDEIQTQFEQEEEKMVTKAVRNVGVNVDKEELIKALQYDRNQYEKGYEDGKNDVLEKIKAEIFVEKKYAYANFEEYKVEFLGQDEEDALDSLPQDDFRYGMERALEIIDKYKTEV